MERPPDDKYDGLAQSNVDLSINDLSGALGTTADALKDLQNLLSVAFPCVLCLTLSLCLLSMSDGVKNLMISLGHHHVYFFPSSITNLI
jgi:hypothetical protein